MNVKPCQKCGDIGFYMLHDGEGFRVVCSDCDEQGPFRKTKEDAIKAWNDAGDAAGDSEDLVSRIRAREKRLERVAFLAAELVSIMERRDSAEAIEKWEELKKSLKELENKDE